MTGDELRDMRHTLGWTQQRLGDELGVARNTIARWEREEIAIRHGVLIRAAVRRMMEARGQSDGAL